MKYINVILLCFLLLSIDISLPAQVKNIKERIEKDKDKGSSKGSGGVNFDDDGTFFGNLFFSWIPNTLINAQNASLERLDDYPQRISFETFSTAGTAFENRTNHFQFGLRYIRGIWSSDFKYDRLIDRTGSLNAID